jgi:hypothetical protein
MQMLIHLAEASLEVQLNLRITSERHKKSEWRTVTREGKFEAAMWLTEASIRSRKTGITTGLIPRIAQI